MLHLKILLSCFCLQAVVAAAATITSNSEQFPSDELNDAIPLSTDDIIPKANWSPICQNVEVKPVEEFIPVLNVELPGVARSPVRSTVKNGNDTCDAPNGLGLKNLLKQSKALIPFDRLKVIISNATNDPEVTRLKNLIHSENFRTKIHKFLESSHFAIFRDYVCQSLYLDLKKFWQYVKNLMSIETLKETPGEEVIENSKGRAEIIGLIQDLHEALPKQKLRDLYVNLLVSDEQLMAAIRRMRSDEFKQLIKNLTKVEEYNDLKGMLQKVGVPLQSVKDLIDVALGWYVNELEENFEKI